jgi:hypothetical protein
MELGFYIVFVLLVINLVITRSFMVLLAFFGWNWGNYPWLESFNYLPFLGGKKQRLKLMDQEKKGNPD